MRSRIRSRTLDRLQISGRCRPTRSRASHTGALEAGRKLGVDAVLNGEIAEQPGGLRVTVRLTATKDARVLWSRVYERQPADIIAVQSSIAAAVVRELVGLLNREGLFGVPNAEPESRDLEVYQLYLRGAHQVRLRGEDSLRLAVDLFSSAARRDPSYARAQVGLASAYALLPSYSFEDPTEMYALADKALANADRLSKNRSETAGTRGYLAFMRGQWIEAETAFRTAIVADPNNPEVRQMYSQLLGAVGRIDAALTQARLAQEIDPLAPVVADRLGILHLWLGRDADAESDAALARELGLDEVAYPETKILLKLHQHDDARSRRRPAHFAACPASIGCVGRPDNRGLSAPREASGRRPASRSDFGGGRASRRASTSARWCCSSLRHERCVALPRYRIAAAMTSNFCFPSMPPRYDATRRSVTSFATWASKPTGIGLGGPGPAIARARKSPVTEKALWGSSSRVAPTCEPSVRIRPGGRAAKSRYPRLRA